MTSEALIDSLTKNLKPVRIAPSPRRMSLLYAVTTVSLVSVLVIAAWGVRPNLSTWWVEIRMGSLILSSLGVIFSSSFAAFCLSRPGYPLSPEKARLPEWSLGIFFAVMALQWVPPGVPLMEGLTMGGGRCTGALLALTVLPALLFLVVMRSLAPVNSMRTARLVGLSAGAVGAFGLALLCPSEHCVHLLVYHGVPVILCGIALPWLAAPFLRW